MRRIAFVCTFRVGITAATVATAHNPVPSYQTGQNYKVLNNPSNRPTSSAVRAKEFFLYSCSYCFPFKMRLATWVRHLAPDVQFSYLPVIYGRSSRIFARIYDMEPALRMVDQLHDRVFHASSTTSTVGSVGHKPSFSNVHSLCIKRFLQLYESQPVTQSMHRAPKRMRRCGARSVPTLVTGRYWFSDGTAESNPRMP